MFVIRSLGEAVKATKMIEKAASTIPQVVFLSIPVVFPMGW